MTKYLSIYRFFGLPLVLLILAVPRSAQADVRMPGIFGNHMVLQQDAKIPVWGWADAGEVVTVALGDQTAKTTADANGKWRIDLAQVKTTSLPLTLTVKGKNDLKFDDVLVGDVWLCSGQSNMEFPLKTALNASTAVPQAKDNLLRLFLVPRRRALEPLDDVRGSSIDMYKSGNSFGLKPGDDERGAWVVCTPQTAAGFSAVGFFFGKNLRTAMNRPIGLIGAYWGGTPAEAWTDLSTLEGNPSLRRIIPGYQKAVTAFPGGNADMEAQSAAYDLAFKKWVRDMAASPDKPAYDATVKAWNDNAAILQAQGKPLPRRPAPPIPPPIAPPCGLTVPTLLFNGMIAPLIPYAIKGVIWYQGEANANDVQSSLQYHTLFSSMITGWRDKWSEGNFPFLFVQLANFRPRPNTAGDVSPWAVLREEQTKTLTLPNTGMAVIIDLGTAKNIHPPDKMDVGYRLALVARHVAYGENLVYTGPAYASMKVDGNKIRIAYSQIGSGLTLGSSPFLDSAVPPVSTTELKGFAISGIDQNWVWANAKIEGTQVVVSSVQVPNPVAVRYGWADNPECNLYNKEGLPASPFRTDNFLLLAPPGRRGPVPKTP